MDRKWNLLFWSITSAITLLLLGTAFANTIPLASAQDITLECTDGKDNDGDGLIDADDPGCQHADGNHDVTDDDESDATTQCQDSLDNDGDGNIDAEDRGCQDIEGNYVPTDNDESGEAEEEEEEDEEEEEEEGGQCDQLRGLERALCRVGEDIIEQGGEIPELDEATGHCMPGEKRIGLRNAWCKLQNNLNRKSTGRTTGRLTRNRERRFARVARRQRRGSGEEADVQQQSFQLQIREVQGRIDARERATLQRQIRQNLRRDSSDLRKERTLERRRSLREERRSRRDERPTRRTRNVEKFRGRTRNVQTRRRFSNGQSLLLPRYKKTSDRDRVTRVYRSNSFNRGSSRPSGFLRLRKDE